MWCFRVAAGSSPLLDTIALVAGEEVNVIGGDDAADAAIARKVWCATHLRSTADNLLRLAYLVHDPNTSYSWYRAARGTLSATGMEQTEGKARMPRNWLCPFLST